MPKPNQKPNMSEQLSQLLCALAEGAFEGLDNVRLAISEEGKKDADITLRNIETYSDLSKQISELFPKDSEMTSKGKLTITLTNDESLTASLSDVNIIYAQLTNENTNETSDAQLTNSESDKPSLGEKGEILLGILKEKLKGQSLSDFVAGAEQVAQQVAEWTVVQAEDEAKPEEKSADTEEPVQDEEAPDDDLLNGDLSKILGDGKWRTLTGEEKEILETAEVRDVLTREIAGVKLSREANPQANNAQEEGEEIDFPKSHIGFGGLTSASKTRLSTELETLNTGESGFSKTMKDFVGQLKKLNDLTDLLYPDKNGDCKPMTVGNARELQRLYRELTQKADAITCPHYNEYKTLNDNDKKYLKTVQSIHDFLERDNNELSNHDPKEFAGLFLPEALWALRTKKLRISEKDAERIGGTMSTRLTLMINGQPCFVTPITNYDADSKKSFEEIRNRIAAENPWAKDALMSLKVTNPEAFIRKTLGDEKMQCELTGTQLAERAKGLIKGNVDMSFWNGPFKQLYEETSRVCRQNIEMEQVGASKGSTISRRSLGVSAIYKMFDRGSYIPTTGTVILNGKPYIYMAKGEGEDADRPDPKGNIAEWVKQVEGDNPPKVSAKAAKQLMDSQVLDFIGGNVDRHVKNFLYRFVKDEKGKIILDGFDNIDNDMSFGTKTEEERNAFKENVIDQGKDPGMGSQHYCPPERFRYIAKDVADKVKAMVAGATGDEVPEKFKNELLPQKLSDDEIKESWNRAKKIAALIDRREKINEAIEDKIVSEPEDPKWNLLTTEEREKRYPGYKKYDKERDEWVDRQLEAPENPTYENKSRNELYDLYEPFRVPITDAEKRKEKLEKLLAGGELSYTEPDGKKVVIDQKLWDETPEILSQAQINAIGEKDGGWSKHIQEIAGNGKFEAHREFNTNYFHRIKEAVELTNHHIKEYEKDFGKEKRPLSDATKLTGKLLNAQTALQNERRTVLSQSNEKDFEDIRQYAIKTEAEKRVVKYTEVQVIDETKSPSDLTSVRELLTNMNKQLEANDFWFHKNTDEYNKMKLALDNTLAGLNAKDADEENMLEQFAALRDATKEYIGKKGPQLRSSSFGTVRLDVAKQLNSLAQEKTELVQNRAISQARYMYKTCEAIGAESEKDSPDFSRIMNFAARGFKEVALGVNNGLAEAVGKMKQNKSYMLDCMMVAAAAINARKDNNQPGKLENDLKKGSEFVKGFLSGLHKSETMVKARKVMNEKDLFALTAMKRFDCLQDSTKAPTLPSVWKDALVKSGKMKVVEPKVQVKQAQQSPLGL